MPGKALRLTPLAVAALLVSAECRADWKFTPTIGVTETYSDNPGLQIDSMARPQFVSEATAAFKFASKSHRLRTSAYGDFHAYGYQEKDTPGVRDQDRRYGANIDATLVDGLLFLDAGANRSSQAISAFGTTVASPFSALNRTDIKTWRISPILKHRFGTQADLLVQFTRDGVTSTGPTANFGDSVSKTLQANLNSVLGHSALDWGVRYLRQDLTSDRFGTSVVKNASGNLRYRLSRTWSATASAGYDDYAFPSLRNRDAGPSYYVGFVWTPSSRTQIEASIGHSYLGKTGSLSILQRSRSVVSRVSYTDQVTTTRSQFLLPAAIDTASMLDRLLSSTIADPIARAQAVQSYIAATGLPLSLANPINYLSNRYTRDKLLQAAFIVTLPHGGLTMSVFKSDRTALSLQESDSALLGNQFASLNDHVRQYGVGASYNYRLSTRTSFYANLLGSRSTSVTTGLVTPNNSITAGLSRKFDRRILGTLELRHIYSTLNGTLNAAPARIENAASATISVQF